MFFFLIRSYFTFALKCSYFSRTQLLWSTFSQLSEAATGYQPATLLKERLWHSCFPVNFAKFLRTRFLQNTYGWLLLNFLSWWRKPVVEYFFSCKFTIKGFHKILVNFPEIFRTAIFTEQPWMTASGKCFEPKILKSTSIRKK